MSERGSLPHVAAGRGCGTLFFRCITNDVWSLPVLRLREKMKTMIEAHMER